MGVVDVGRSVGVGTGSDIILLEGLDENGEVGGQVIGNFDVGTGLSVLLVPGNTVSRFIFVGEEDDMDKR